MSAVKEAAYVLPVNRLTEKITLTKNPNTTITPPPSTKDQVDVLPEIMRHSLPPKMFASHPQSLSTLTTTSKWLLHTDPKNGVSSSTINADALNPLRAYVSLPQVTFGPKRWQLPNQEHSVMVSTANEMRKDLYNPASVNPEKLRAVAKGLGQIGAAFAIATAIIFGGGAIVFGWIASWLELHNVKGLSKEELEVRSDLVSALKDRIETVPEGSTSAANNKTGTSWAPSTGIKFDSTYDGKFDSEYFQQTEESDQFRRMKQDQGLDTIAEGLDTLKNMARAKILLMPERWKPHSENLTSTWMKRR